MWSTASSQHSTAKASKSAFTPQQRHMCQPISHNNRRVGATPAKATRATQQEANLRTRGRLRSRENRRRNPASPSPAHTLQPKSSTRHKADGANRWADSCKPDSAYMRHRMWRSWKEWENIGASGQVLQWIREGVSTTDHHHHSTKAYHYWTPHRSNSRLSTRNWQDSSRQERWSTLQTLSSFRGCSSSRNPARTSGFSSTIYPT
jgi:hypothetical protein